MRAIITALLLYSCAHAVSAGLIAYWPFDNSAANAVATGPSGALTGNTVYNNTQTPGPISSTHALQFDGNGDNFLINDTGHLGTLETVFEADFSLSLWIRSDQDASALTGATSMRSAIDFGQSHGNGMSVLFNQNHVSWNPDDNGIDGSGTIGFYLGNQQVSSGVTGAANTWYHVTLINEANTASIYVDGALGASRALGGTPSISWSAVPAGANGPFVIGDQAKTGSRDWLGHIDDVAIWDRALTPTEVGQLFGGTSPLAIPEPSGLVLCSLGALLLHRLRRTKA